MNIKEIEREGTTKELIRRIDLELHRIGETNWRNIRDQDNFTRLGDAIEDAQAIIYELGELLNALQELASENE